MIAVLCGLAWRIVRYGLHFELTGDESGIMLSVMERGYAALLEPLSYSNVSPPLFLWMTKFLDSLFQNDWAVRLIPFLAGLGAVAMFGLICREALDRTARWVAWAIFSVTYVPIVEGTRVKGYTIDLLVATVMLWLMLRWLLHGRKARYLVGLALCAPVFAWLSYTAVFIIGAVGLIFTGRLVKNRFMPISALDESERLGWPNVAAGLAFVALASVSAILLYELNVRRGLQVSLRNGLADAWRQGYPPDQPWKIPFWLLTAQTGRGFAWPIGDNHFRSALTCALWLTGLVVYWRRGNRWVWALFVAPQVLALAAAFLHKYPYLQNPRLCMFLGPGICLFVGRGAQYLIDRMDPEKGRRLYCFTAFALAMYALGGMGRDIVLRVREVHGPGIRSTLVEASRLAGPDGQFVVLNLEHASDVSDVFAYYLKREVKQRVWFNGQIPTQTGPGLRLALVAVGSEVSNSDGNSLLGGFERRFGRPMKVTWSQAAHEALLDKSDSIVVWVCE
jgi:4-amino-4-deoxy-L-arabinose transferase-like glycosyltransferase